MRDVAIIVPCYNEAERLDVWAFRRYLRTDSRCRFVFVDDGSRDATVKRLEGLRAGSSDRVEILSLPQNRGKAEAVRHGLQFAILEGATHVGFWDADLATPLESIPEFVRVLDRRPQTDIVIGTRLNLRGREIARNRMRGLLGTLFGRTASTVLGVHIVDTQCGAKLFRSTAGLWSALSEPFRARWIFDVELFARMQQQTQWGFRPLSETIYEYPLDGWREVAGSKLRLRDFLRAPVELAAIYSRYLSPWATPRKTPAPPVSAAASPALVFTRPDSQVEIAKKAA